MKDQQHTDHSEDSPAVATIDTFADEISEQFDISVGSADKLVAVVKDVTSAYLICDELFYHGANEVRIHRELVTAP